MEWRGGRVGSRGGVLGFWGFAGAEVLQYQGRRFVWRGLGCRSTKGVDLFSNVGGTVFSVTEAVIYNFQNK